VVTHRNHYVPQWYQRRFMTDSRTPLFYLDLTPDPIILPDGQRILRPALQRNTPKYCFWGQDLYTTVFGSVENDEIERYLFGAIDNDGANAVRAVVDGDLKTIHELFQRFFEYLDAQKLRTPKGLDWIRKQYAQLDQLQLMLEMQHLRQMHSTMWLEAVREVVSAEDSNVKFILTDHPVTIYHPDCSPSSPACIYPDDPDIALKGSQTLFPLGPDHCLILTNLEYAQDPDRGDLLELRENARHFGRTIARIDAWIRRRKLTVQEVVAINHILKSRARRYIAATEEEWLYPERTASSDWRLNGKVLLPPRGDVSRFGGEIYIGYDGGRTEYQDAFGRTSLSHEYLRKEPLATPQQPKDRCACGSGRTFEACCRDLDSADRMPTTVCSIRERNLMFMRAIDKILGFDQGKSWEEIRRELSDDQVKSIHSAYAALWPKETNLTELLPRPDDRVFRALYVGLIDARTIAASVVAWLPYFDEIIVLNPFLNAAFIRPEYSPVESPAQYREQTLKNVALFSSLIPYIDAGIVHMVPDPMEYNDTFREMIWKTAKERVGTAKITPEDSVFVRKLGKDDLKRMMGRLSDESLRHQIKASSPDLDDDEVEGVIRHIRENHAHDPLALDQPLRSGKDNSNLQVFRGINFELAMFLAQLTGAALYTDQRATTNDLAAATAPPTVTGTGAAPSTVERILPVRLFIESQPRAILARRVATGFTAFRAAIRELWKVTTAESLRSDGSRLPAALDALAQTSSAMMAEPVGKEPDGITSAVFEISATLVVPPEGYRLIAAQRFVVAFGRRKHIDAVPLALLFGRAVPGSPDSISDAESD
jgi:hypothetical protein